VCVCVGVWVCGCVGGCVYVGVWVGVCMCALGVYDMCVYDMLCVWGCVWYVCVYIYVTCIPGNTKGGSITDLLFGWFGISCMTTDNFCFYLQNRLIQTSQTGGQWYSDTSPFSIPCVYIFRKIDRYIHTHTPHTHTQTHTTHHTHTHTHHTNTHKHTQTHTHTNTHKHTHTHTHNI
jgi:hypothetical protein